MYNDAINSLNLLNHLVERERKGEGEGTLCNLVYIDICWRVVRKVRKNVFSRKYYSYEDLTKEIQRLLAQF